MEHKHLPRAMNVLLLAALVGAAYLPLLRAGYIWDDDAYVTANLNLHDATGLKRIWLEPQTSPQYYPLVFTTFWLERQVFGPGPAPGHAINVLLHLLAALLLWRILDHLGVRPAFFIALVFALHPLELESVAWITERKNVLSAVFALGALHCFLPWITRPSNTPRHPGRYGLGLLLFVAALLSKSVTATLPAVILLLAWWRQERFPRRTALAMLPLLALGAASGLFTAWTEAHFVGASGAEWSLSFLERTLLAGRVAWFYAAKLLWPHPLIFIYPRWTISATDPWAYLYPIAALGLIVACWRLRPRFGNGPLTAVLIYAVTLFPAMGFLNVYPMRYSFVADHFQYLAGIALLALLIPLGLRLLRKTGRPRLVPVAAGLLVCLLLALDWREGRKYHDAQALWHDTIAKNADCWLAHNNLGNLLIRQGRTAEARASFAEVLRLRPEQASAYNNIGETWHTEGNLPLALQSYAKALELNPDYAEAYNNQGVVLGKSGRAAEARQSFRHALRLDPGYAMAHHNLANALARQGDYAEAETHYREALRLRSDFALARFNYGLCLVAQRRGREAAPLFARAFRELPDFFLGHQLLGTLLLRQGDLDGAIWHFRQVLSIRPSYAPARQGLALALERKNPPRNRTRAPERK